MIRLGSKKEIIYYYNHMFAESQVLHMVSVWHSKESGISTIDYVEEQMQISRIPLSN
jgi:hypothetical protein